MFYHTIDLRPHIMQGTILQFSSSTPASYRLSSSRVESFARTLLIAGEARKTCLRDNVRSLILPHGCGVQLDAFEYCSDVVCLQTELYKGGRSEAVPQGYYGEMSPRMWACTLHPHFLPAKPVWKPKKRSFESPLMYLYLLVDRYPGNNYSIRKLDITIPKVSRAVMISGNIIRALLFECNQDEAIAWVKDTLLAQNPKALIIDQVFKFCDAFLFVEKMQDPRIVLTSRNYSNAIATKTNIPFEEYIKFAEVHRLSSKEKTVACDTRALSKATASRQPSSSSSPRNDIRIRKERSDGRSDTTTYGKDTNAVSYHALYLMSR